jgi:hypothetical protein
VETCHRELVGLGITDYPLATCLRDCTLSKLLIAYGLVSGEDMLDLSGDRGDALIGALRSHLFSRLPAGPWDGLLA